MHYNAHIQDRPLIAKNRSVANNPVAVGNRIPAIPVLKKKRAITPVIQPEETTIAGPGHVISPLQGQFVIQRTLPDSTPIPDPAIDDNEKYTLFTRWYYTGYGFESGMKPEEAYKLLDDKFERWYQKLIAKLWAVIIKKEKILSVKEAQNDLKFTLHGMDFKVGEKQIAGLYYSPQKEQKLPSNKHFLSYLKKNATPDPGKGDIITVLTSEGESIVQKTLDFINKGKSLTVSEDHTNVIVDVNGIKWGVHKANDCQIYPIAGQTGTGLFYDVPQDKWYSTNWFGL